ncbi:MAG: tRNA pseudouridine(38-40) synthase TruA [Desulfotalea sp.]|nr:MAG: tRNA pseudouridine(38-40) synthase TruA [Desulfotalea sp.]
MSQPTRTIKLIISFDGTGFCGWQKQRIDKTIQGELEQCLSTMTTEAICVHGAGRTDAGVHALAMVAHFSCNSQIPCAVMQRGANSMLPGAIRILQLREVDDTFHARYLATGKKYHYSIYTGKIQPPFNRLTSLHVTQHLNFPQIIQCLDIVTGTHDFSSFENSGSRDKTLTTGRGAVRTIHSATLIHPEKDQIIVAFTGDGFLKNMVRNLVGTIIEVGKERLSATAFKEILEMRDRTKARETAPAHGLTLIEVYYDL